MRRRRPARPRARGSPVRLATRNGPARIAGRLAHRRGRRELRAPHRTVEGDRHAAEAPPARSKTWRECCDEARRDADRHRQIAATGAGQDAAVPSVHARRGRGPGRGRARRHPRHARRGAGPPARHRARRPPRSVAPTRVRRRAASRRRPRRAPRERVRTLARAGVPRRHGHAAAGRTLVSTAAAMLTDRDTDAVLGPALDGGWWGIGLRRPDRPRLRRRRDEHGSHPCPTTSPACRARAPDPAARAAARRRRFRGRAGGRRARSRVALRRTRSPSSSRGFTHERSRSEQHDANAEPRHVATVAVPPYPRRSGAPGAGRLVGSHR